MSIRSSRASVAVHESWAATTDRPARTAAARAARWQRYLDRARELQGPEASVEAVEQAAEHLRKADASRMALASAKVRKAKAAARKAAQASGKAQNRRPDDAT